jgi:hypothetical protein
LEQRLLHGQLLLVVEVAEEALLAEALVVSLITRWSFTAAWVWLVRQPA